MKKVRRDWSRVKNFFNYTGLVLMFVYMVHLMVCAMFG